MEMRVFLVFFFSLVFLGNDVKGREIGYAWLRIDRPPTVVSVYFFFFLKCILIWIRGMVFEGLKGRGLCRNDLKRRVFGFIERTRREPLKGERWGVFSERWCQSFESIVSLSRSFYSFEKHS